MSSVNPYPNSTKVFMYLNEAMYERRNQAGEDLVFKEFTGQWGLNYKVDGEPPAIKKWLKEISRDNTISTRCRTIIKKKLKELSPYIKTE